MRLQPLKAPLGQSVDWDGQSPINGEPVTSDVQLAGERYVFTKSRMYIVEPKPEIINENGTLPPAGKNS